ncbi:16S rRNA (guanine(527)-N(7))-methyltransferase RsmG [Clostridium aminobutyricum]|nr:16S rRNA (guanine(527)-N(7))-methyltransferase RsmG [Clostridium aminobutyricum]
MKQLEKALDTLSIPYTEEMIDKFERYMQLVLEWNEKVNLTAITEREEFIKKHFIDSVLCYSFPEMKKAQTVIDVGTGAGFPGIPLALVYPEKKFVLMDSLNKRLKIIDQICSDLDIQNVKTLHGRAEDLGKSKMYREKYDICVSRAVANLATLSEYCLPFIKVGGAFLAYKGNKAEEEIKEAEKAIHLLGGKLMEERQVKLDDFDLDHHIRVISKCKNTPAKFPRKAGTPSKEPLK